MNTLMNEMKTNLNLKYTENGALAHTSTNNPVYDLFATGAAYRKRSDEDCIELFRKAFEADETLAMKCLFWIRDVRGGAGERRFFRVCFKWLAQTHPEAASRNLQFLSEYGRWDDLYCVFDTPLENEALNIIKHQLALDVECKTPSLLAKWLASENTSSQETRRLGTKTRKYLDMTHKQYRKTLSVLRERIKVLERLMSQNRWQEIIFDSIPSKAGLIYKNAFARRDVIAKKYEAFAKSEDTKVNAKALFPYEVVSKAVDAAFPTYWWREAKDIDPVDRAMINKYWENLPDYLEGKPCKMMCVVDTSASMIDIGNAAAPINVAISLGMYCAERVGGPFKGHYISFSKDPRLVAVEGKDFVDKVTKIFSSNVCQNTDLCRTFRVLKELSKQCAKEDRLDTVIVISDMEIDQGSFFHGDDMVRTEMENMRREWEDEGLVMPHLCYWNVDARHDTFLDNGPDVTYVSGCSPTIFKSVLTGKTGWQLCLEVLGGKRYEAIK